MRSLCTNERLGRSPTKSGTSKSRAASCATAAATPSAASRSLARGSKILAGGDARERCIASGRTRDGLLNVAGPAPESEVTDRWTITASRDAYHGAHGTVILRDIRDHETLITATVTPRIGPWCTSG